MIDIRITFTSSASTNPPNPPYQGNWVTCAVKTVARNGMEGGYTQGNVNIQTRLTEPQGNFKKFDTPRVSLYRTESRALDAPVVRSARL